MRVILIIGIFQLVLWTKPVFCEEMLLTKDRDIKTISVDEKNIHNKLKAGLVFGYPLGVTAGYRFSNFFELNGTIGTDYNHLTTGINGLFTLFNLKIYHEVFPVSFGPAVYTHFNQYENNSGYDRYVRVDLLGVFRIEYSFEDIPLNLFLEAGLGLQIIKFADDAGCFVLGIRYIF